MLNQNDNTWLCHGDTRVLYFAGALLSPFYVPLCLHSLHAQTGVAELTHAADMAVRRGIDFFLLVH
jgi:hypothetical protein